MRASSVPGIVGRLLLRLAVSTILVAAFLVLSQDLQVFPGAWDRLVPASRFNIPAEVEALYATAEDGHRVPIWKMSAASLAEGKRFALLFHGNAERLQTTLGVQRWMRNRGIGTYALEYRGFGQAGGWPSEKGLQLDGEAAIDLLLRREHLEADDIIIFGRSVGTGPAAYIAAKYQVGVLVLISPYSSLRAIVEGHPLFKYLSGFFWYDIPTADYVSKLRSTCVVAAHGKWDNVIPYQETEIVRSAYRGNTSYLLISSDESGHNDILARALPRLNAAISDCLAPRNGQSMQ